jgi:hypothetical protein
MQGTLLKAEGGLSNDRATTLAAKTPIRPLGIHAFASTSLARAAFLPFLMSTSGPFPNRYGCCLKCRDNQGKLFTGRYCGCASGVVNCFSYAPLSAHPRFLNELCRPLPTPVTRLVCRLISQTLEHEESSKEDGELR